MQFLLLFCYISSLRPYTLLRTLFFLIHSACDFLPKYASACHTHKYSELTKKIPNSKEQRISCEEGSQVANKFPAFYET